MLRSLCALGLTLFYCIPLHAQPDLHSLVIDPPTTTTFYSARCEVPPWIIGGDGDWRSYFFVDGIGGYVGSANGSMANGPDITLQTGPAMITAPLDHCQPQPGQDWRRTYYAVYSAQYLDHPVEGPVTIGFLHAENKTSCSDGKVTCQNSVDVLHLRQTCPIGDDWERYNSFVCAAWIPNSRSTNWGQQRFPNDMGPIVWPSTGYLQANGEKFTCGVNTPSSIQYDGYVYVFFHDDGQYGAAGSPPFYPPPEEEGRHEGIKVARAPIADALTPRAWQVFYRDPAGVESWHASLPEGFTKENIARFWNVPGPRSTDIMGDEGNNLYGEIRFSVARVRDADYFIGVESYTDYSDPAVGPDGHPAIRVRKALRYSRDLVHWSDRKLIIETAGDWTLSNLNYPVLLSSDGWSNNLIDSTDFYVVGTNSIISNNVNKVHIHLPSTSRTQPQVATGNPFRSDSLVEFSGIYPNPAHGIFRLSYALQHTAAIQVNIGDCAGRRLLMATTTVWLPGRHIQDFDISRFGKGIFLVDLLIDGRRHTFKLLND